jgi:uncharacterized membrane protein
VSESVEIKKIVIKINDTELSLSPDDARELKKILDELIGTKETVYVPSYPHYPIYWYYEQPMTQPYRWTINCDSSNNTLCISNTI